MPRVKAVLETCLYVDDLGRSQRFYRELFDFPVLVADERLCALAVAVDSVLILFLRGSTAEPLWIPGGLIPPHDGEGETHFAFSIDAVELDDWRREVAARGIAIESEVRWPLGGTSIYFRDPDRHLVELATPGIWDFEAAFARNA